MSSLDQPPRRPDRTTWRTRAAGPSLSEVLQDGAPPPADVGGRTLGPFRLEALLAAGGMGAVYRARPGDGGPAVALKVLLEARQHEPVARRRFLRECAATAALEHPHIVRVLGSGEDDGIPWLALELVEGTTLRAALGQRPRAELLQLLVRVAEAVGHAHARGVLHRDLKPENVLVRAADGEPLVTDFGLARNLDVMSSLTRPGQLLGTPRYMAPEQLADEPTGPPADVWALGVMLYEVLTGRRPFVHTERIVLSLLIAIRSEEPAAPRALDPTVEAAVERVCLRALRKDPAQRHPTAAGFAAELRAALG